MRAARKFYIRMHGATETTWYWSQPAQNWTTDALQATFFVSAAEASEEAVYADAHGPGEAWVCERRSAS